MHRSKIVDREIRSLEWDRVGLQSTVLQVISVVALHSAPPHLGVEERDQRNRGPMSTRYVPFLLLGIAGGHVRSESIQCVPLLSPARPWGSEVLWDAKGLLVA